jgi:hypothetical protein
MGRLRDLSGTRLGTFSFTGRDPATGTVEFAVTLQNEVIPFDMTLWGRTGYPAALAATSLGWSSKYITAVIRDAEGRYHAVETNVPRVSFDGRATFQPADGNFPFEFVRLVAVPIDFDGPVLRERIKGKCLVESSLVASLEHTAASLRLEQTVKDAVKKWDAWWQVHVENVRSPPVPPPEITKPFVDTSRILFDLAPAEIAVLRSKDEQVPNRLSLDFFDRKDRGEAGATQTQLDDRLSGRDRDSVEVVLTLKVDSFVGAQLRRVLATGIHEAAHFRHYVLASDLIEQWRRSRPKVRSSGTGNRGAFFEFLDQEKRRNRLSTIERAIVHSAFHYIEATHPFAQVHAFMGTYPLYVRERSTSLAPRGLLPQLRFEQLQMAAGYWRNVRARDVAALAVDAVAAFARQDGACTIEDLNELAMEIAALPAYPFPEYFAALSTALAKP